MNSRGARRQQRGGAPLVGRKERWANRAWMLAVLAVTAWVLFEGQRTFRADMASAGARKQVSQWVSGAVALPSSEEWASARDAIAYAVSVTPDDATMHEALGNVYMVAGQRDWAEETTRRPHFETAIGNYLQATKLSPQSPQPWADLALAYAALGNQPAAMRAAWRKALALGPNEAFIQPMLMQAALQTWKDAPPAMQKWAMDFFEQSDTSTRNAINAMALQYGLHFEPDAGSR